MIRMRGNNVGVEKLSKNDKSGNWISMPEDTTFTGIVKYVGRSVDDPDIEVGKKVYFGSQRETVRIGGAEIMVMTEDNIVAVVDEGAQSNEEEAVQ